jgi:hypothetical protein
MFCFLFNLHYVAILSAAKLSDFFHPLIHQREMTAGHRTPGYHRQKHFICEMARFLGFE